VPSGLYKYNLAMCELNVFRGEPIVSPDDIASGLDERHLLFKNFKKVMTPTELPKIRSELLRGMNDEQFVRVDVSH
jgi:hypothetical protein